MGRREPGIEMILHNKTSEILDFLEVL